MKMDTQSLKTGAKWLVGTASSVGVPAYSFFTSYTPPLFPGISIITAALSGAILFVVACWTPKPDKKSATLPGIVRMGGKILFISLILIIVYILFLQSTTVVNPNQQSDRFQIGFWKCDWTLTEYGKELKDKNPSWTTTAMLESDGFAQDRVPIIWETLSVYIAGTLLILLYLSGFIMWAIGFGMLSKQESIKKQQQNKPGEKI